MCDTNSDCPNGQRCVNGICQSSSNGPVVPVVPPEETQVETEDQEDKEEKEDDKEG